MDDTTSFGPFLDMNISDFSLPSGNVTFNFTPTFDKPMNDCVIIEGSAADFEVVISGCLETAVVFFVNGTLLVDGHDNVSIAHANGHHHLTIQNCQISKHKGFVLARAENEFGQAESKGLLNVMSKSGEIMDQQHSFNNTENQEQAERIAEIEPNEPTEHSTANPIIDSENNEVPNTVLPENAPFVNISITANEPTAPSVGPTVNENTPNYENNEAHNVILPKTVPSVSISIAPVQAERIAESEPNEPNKHFTDIPENNHVPNTVSPKREPSVNISAAPIETIEPNKQPATCPNTQNTPNCENTEALDSINISTASVLVKPHVEMDLPSQNSLSRKRRFPVNVCNDLAETREKRRLVMNDEQLESRDVNHGNAYDPSQALMNAAISQQDDRFRNMTTLAQLGQKVQNGSAPKTKLVDISIYIASGNVSFQTSEGEKVRYKPLRKHVSILQKCVADDRGCKAFISFGCSGCEFISSGKKFDDFSDDIRSISHLWANGRLVAFLSEYGEYQNNMLPISDLCNKLFNGNSILASRELQIEVHSGWPWKIVKNVAHICKRIIVNGRTYVYR